jgi:hypothetical protein
MKFRLVAIVCLFLAANALAQEKAPEKHQQGKLATALNTDVAAAEARSRKLWEDYKNRDKAALSTTLSESFRGIEEGGDFFGAKEYLSTLDEFELKSYTLSDYIIMPLATGDVLINYHARYEGAAAGETTHGNAGFSEVWIRRGGNWKLQYLQETYVK